MPTYTAREQEALDTYERLVATRGRIEAGELAWSVLADFFTEDAWYIDPAWGLVEGNAAIATFMEESMAGLDDWIFPEEWRMVDGDRVVAMFQNRLPGDRDDGRPHQAPGLSILTYAGDGRFSSETDLINMVHMFEVMKASGWMPTGPINLPPAEPIRDEPVREEPLRS